MTGVSATKCANQGAEDNPDERENGMGRPILVPLVAEIPVFPHCEVIPTAIHACFRSGYNPIIRASAILISANKEQRGVSV